MTHPRDYRQFTYREAVFRICCDRFDVVTAEIMRQRHVLEDYVRENPGFQKALSPLAVSPSAPEVAQRMARAAKLVGVGPMAAVAGAMAQLAVETAVAAGAREAIVENGGDIFMVLREPAVIGLHTGSAKVSDRLALRVLPGDTPLSICSSSGLMGHSISFGRCDLATIVSRDAALADAAATEAANSVKRIEDIDRTLNRLAAIEGVLGVLIVKDDRVGLAGCLPELIRKRA